ncbi:MAG TPA: hypothetical protein VGO00_28770, partial [Kofleriaceae bacterium]|nr:hypothetical protein [Kofleriaceae bacterium]
MRAALFLVIAATSIGAADPAKPLTADDTKATQLLDKIAADDAAARKADIDALTALAPRAVDGIDSFLRRDHATSVAERRKILDAIKAAVPDKRGTFSQPQRMNGSEQQADEAVDWLAKLETVDLSKIPAAKPTTPPTTEDLPKALGEVLADDVAIRALAASKEIRAAQLIFDVSFDDATMIYRDECGRYIRKMEPLSIPALTKEAQGKNFDRSRYATYQLERLDRQEPQHALQAAQDNEALTIAILDVFRATKHREAVHAVWTKVNDDSGRVRTAARAAWMEYITGPPPPPAPRRRLQLPGGKLTKKPKPLWLTYRELADNELRKAANDTFQEDYPLDDPSTDDIDRRDKTVKIDLEQMTKRLFDYYDGERAKKEESEWTAAKAKADAGDLAAATTMLDRQLAANPERTQAPAMAKIYFAWGKALEAKKQWVDAAAAYSKAQG